MTTRVHPSHPPSRFRFDGSRRTRAARGALQLLAALFLLGPAALAEAAAPGGEPVEEDALESAPSEIRDEHLLAQPRLTLPATGPATLGRGRTSWRASVLWSNSFGWTQDVPGEHPADRRFLVDGETATLDFMVTHGFTDALDAGLRLPLHWRGGGALDGLIDTWHRLLDLPDGNRPSFVKNAFRAQGVTLDGRPFSWDDERGFGLGSAEVFGRWRLAEGPGWSSALVGRLALPTGTGAFAGNGFGLGLQWVGARRLGTAFDLYLGLGGTAQAKEHVRGVGYEAVRGYAFLAVGWRAARRLSVVAETNLASRLVRDIDRYPGTHWLINGAMHIALSPTARLELGFTENFASQIATTDFALQAGLRLRPASRRGPPPCAPRARR
jgi:hypothetical protein